MLDRAASFFNQPYPYNEDWREYLKVASIFGFFVAIFLFMFRPFGLNNLETSDILYYSLAFGAITFTIIMINNGITRLFPNVFREKKWTLGKEFIWGAYNFWSIGSVNYIFGTGTFNFVDESSGDSFLLGYFAMLLSTFMVGFFPYTFLLLTDHMRKLRKSVEEAKQMNQLIDHKRGIIQIEKKPPNPALIKIEGDNEGESMQIEPADLICMQASGNYVEVFSSQNGTLNKQIFRSTLAKMEDQLSQQTDFYRCHRAYIVNLEKIKHIEGNSQGYRIELDGYTEQVPVARSRNNEFRQLVAHHF